MINLADALKKKLPIKQGGDVFTFNTVGDQIIFKFQGRRTVKTKRGEDSDLIDAQVLGGEKKDPKTKKTHAVKPGAYVFFLNTTLTREFDAAPPALGDILHVQLAEIRPDKNNMKLYGIECLEKGLNDDDIPDFKAPA